MITQRLIMSALIAGLVSGSAPVFAANTTYRPAEPGVTDPVKGKSVDAHAAHKKAKKSKKSKKPKKGDEVPVEPVPMPAPSAPLPPPPMGAPMPAPSAPVPPPQ